MKYFVFIVIVFFTGCGPQYKTFTTYAPPPEAIGKDCVQRCYQEKLACERDAQQNSHICRKEAQLSAKREYLNAKEDYLNQYESWNRMYKNCERKMTADGCKHIYNDKPREPALSDFSKLYSCPDETGVCAANYDFCFEMCGGQIYRETRCVSNCN